MFWSAPAVKPRRFPVPVTMYRDAARRFALEAELKTGARLAVAEKGFDWDDRVIDAWADPPSWMVQAMHGMLEGL
jgi:hypothetical protein